MTLRESNLRIKITQLEAIAERTQQQEQDLKNARMALGFATDPATYQSAPARRINAPIRGNSYTAEVERAGDINNLLRRNGNGASAE